MNGIFTQIGPLRAPSLVVAVEKQNRATERETEAEETEEKDLRIKRGREVLAQAEPKRVTFKID